MNKFNKTLVAAAITGLMAVPGVNAGGLESGYYTKNASGTLKFSGNQCRGLKYKKLNSTISFSSGFEGYFEGGFEGNFYGGSNTGLFNVTLQDTTLGVVYDGSGPLITSNKGRTYNLDTSASGYSGLNGLMASYVFADLPDQTDSKDGCKNPNFWNDDAMVNRYEVKISNNMKRARLRFDAEGTYYDAEKEKNRKTRLRINANMDAAPFPSF